MLILPKMCSRLEDSEVGINQAKLIAKYTIFTIPDNFLAR